MNQGVLYAASRDLGVGIMGKMGQNEPFLWLIGASLGEGHVHITVSRVCFSLPVVDLWRTL